MIRELFPEPETPVTDVNTPSGISASTPLRLFVVTFFSFM